MTANTDARAHARDRHAGAIDTNATSIFLPPIVAGLICWVSADTLTGFANNDPVTTWTDATGNGRDFTQATSSKKPLYKTNIINGLPALFFDATDDAMTSAVPLNDAFTIFAVVDTADAGGGNHRAVQGASNWLLGPYTGAWRSYNSAFIIGSAVSANQFTYLTATSTTGAFAFYVNGASQGTNAGGGTSPGTSVNLGAAGFATNEQLNGHIAEVLIYARVLGSTELSSIHTYLSAKYGI